MTLRYYDCWDLQWIVPEMPVEPVPEPEPEVVLPEPHPEPEPPVVCDEDW